MSWPGKSKQTSGTAVKTSSENNAATYKAGIYNSELSLGDSVISLRVSMDSDHVKSVEIVNLEDSVETMYPLIKPAVKEISDQLAQNVSPEEVVLSDDSPYTSQMILDAVNQVMEQAAIQ